MNYRHAFHAGNFADVVKHILLTRILVHLALKPAPFRVIDTHAGLGHYDLGGEEAGRTGEWRDGIGRLAEPLSGEAEELLGPFRAVLASVRERRGADTYPGSPAILREMLRPQDRAVLIEKHPADGAILRDRYNGARTLKVLTGDGWAALPGLIPPPERRGLVFVDPPFEEPDEWAKAPSRLTAALRRWPTGTIAFWYPLKDPRQADDLESAVRQRSGVTWLRLDLRLREPAAGNALAGTGLLVANPPWRLEEEASVLLPALAERLGSREHAALLGQ